MQTGEIPGVRERMEDLKRRAKEGGASDEWAARKAREAAQRLDQRIREGKAHKPGSTG